MKIAGNSNWETMLYLRLNLMLMSDSDPFTLQDLYKWMNLDFVVKFLHVFGHKNGPIAPEATIRNTANKLTNNMYFERVDRGLYKLTEKGKSKMRDISIAWDKFSEKFKENRN